MAAQLHKSSTFIRDPEICKRPSGTVEILFGPGNHPDFLTFECTDDVMPLLRALAEAVRQMDPAGGEDLLFDAILGNADEQKILTRILSEVRAAKATAAVEPAGWGTQMDDKPAQAEQAEQVVTGPLPLCGAPLSTSCRRLAGHPGKHRGVAEAADVTPAVTA